MKHLLVIFFVATLFSCSGKKKKYVATPQKPEGITEMTFVEEIHDFGKLKAGEVVVYSFLFTNTGEHDLWIERATSDCDCITVKLPQNPIKKGDKNKLEVMLDTSGMFGKNLKPIEIHANCEEPKHLVIFADVESEQLEFNN